MDDKLTYEGVGRIIDQWERIEFTLSRIHSVFADDPDGSEGMRAYGAGRTMLDRLGIIQEQAERWFAKHPNQKREGAFRQLLVEVKGFSDRRNEIAHGIVHAVSGLTVFRLRTTRPDYLVQYAVIPAYHIMKRYHKGGVPKYMYGTPELKVLLERLIGLFLRLGDFLHQIDRQAHR